MVLQTIILQLHALHRGALHRELSLEVRGHARFGLFLHELEELSGGPEVVVGVVAAFFSASGIGIVNQSLFLIDMYYLIHIF